MNGHFEADNTSYPITYMPTLEKGLYRVTDMRCIGTLDQREIPVHLAKRVCQKLNISIQNQKYSDCAPASKDIKDATAALIDLYQDQAAIGE